jgi:beta-1,4-mannosyltransferase
MLRVLMIPAQSNPYQTMLAQALAAQDVEVILGSGPSRRSIAPILGAWRTAGRPRVIHLHWTHRYLAPVCRSQALAEHRMVTELRLLRRMGVRVVWTLHNLGGHEGSRPEHEMRAHRRIAGQCDAVICHCGASVASAMDAYQLPDSARARFVVVPHGSYAGWYPDAMDRADARAALGLEMTQRVFLFIGQIRAYKGVEELLRVFRGIDAPDARLVIAGKPDRKPTRLGIEQAASDEPRIKLELDLIPDDRMQVYLRAADAVVLPYRDVLTSGSAILAMTFGQPVIAPAIGCLPESLGSEGTLLYDPADPVGLEGALRAAMTADLVALGKRAAAHAATLDWGPIAAQTAQLYRGGAGGA